MSAPADVVAVVTSMGRRRHLEAALPALLSRTAFSVLLVDFSCPEGSGDYAESLGSRRVHVLRVPGRARFRLSEARNLGARSDFVSSRPGDPVLAFMDADHVVPRAGCALQRAAHLLGLDEVGSMPGFGGLLLVRRSLFLSSGGYDERFEGWAPEDVEMRVRLHLLGARRADVPRGAVVPIPHDDAARTRHYGGERRASSSRRGFALADALLSRRFGVTLSAFLATPEGRSLAGLPQVRPSRPYPGA